MIANDVQQGRALGEFAATGLKAKKIAIIDDRTAYGQGRPISLKPRSRARAPMW